MVLWSCYHEKLIQASFHATAIPSRKYPFSVDQGSQIGLGSTSARQSDRPGTLSAVVFSHFLSLCMYLCLCILHCCCLSKWCVACQCFFKHFRSTMKLVADKACNRKDTSICRGWQSAWIIRVLHQIQYAVKQRSVRLRNGLTCISQCNIKGMRMPCGMAMTTGNSD